MTTFFHLPREDVVFSLIFSHLSAQETWRLRLVCRDFCRLCDEYFTAFCPSIAYNEPVSEETETLRDRACILRALRTCKKLKNVVLCLSMGKHSSSSLQRASDLLMTAVWRLHADCQLVRLSLLAVHYSCLDPHPGWERLGEKCKTLRELHIEEVSRFDDSCLQNLTKQCTSLVHLTLKSLPAIKGLYFQKLAETTPQLKTVNVSITISIHNCY